MWVWIVCAGIFLFLLGRSLHEGMNSTASRPAAFAGALADGLSLISMAAGVFGLLMAAFLGIFATSGPRLVGNSLNDVLIWSGGLILCAFLLLALGSAARKAGGKAVPGARPRAVAGH
jgi:uncharacterized sodium:solute symporter family permease YidK